MEPTQAIDFTEFISKLTGTITPGDILTILGSVVGIGITFFLMWMGVRKAISAFQSAVSRGKLKL